MKETETKQPSAAKKAGRRLEAYKKSKFYKIMYDKGVLYFLLSFIIPYVLMLYAFKENKLHPFGNENQMLVVDLWHQYFPFFRVVREKLLTGGSFLYSWMNGMGTNFLSLISYYAASPLNWLSIFFSEENARTAITLILMAKIGFCGAFFSCFLRYTFKRKDISICVFSVLYALCSYMLGYYWNVMWFDTIALFPLVMLGVVAICREGKWKTFTFALALSLISNYYVGYFTCIFTVFAFAAIIIIRFSGGIKKGLKDSVYSLWIIARSAVLGIALGGFILLPAYLGLQLTHSVNNTFPTKIEWYESWTDIFANLISYSEPAMKDGLPNFACGMLAIVLFGVFLFSAGIKIREKISALVLLGIIAVSCNMNILNYIWHGFHFTNMIPYRFAFIFSFILITAAYRAYDIILEKGVKIYQIILMLGFPWVIGYLNYMISDAEKFVLEGSLKKSVIISAAFILIFAAIKIFPFTNPKVRNAVMSICIGVAVISECTSNTVIGVKTVGSSDYASYPTKNDEYQALLSAAEKADDDLFYRTEINRTYTLNDSALYGYYGFSQFSSSANVSVTRFSKRLGLYASEAGNRYYYRISTPIVNSMLGIKYIISKDGELNSEEMALKYSGTSGSSVMYENNYNLSIGYMVDEDILLLEDKNYDNPFVYQNELFKLASGTTEDCFTAQPVALASYSGMNVTKRSYGDYNFTKTNGAESSASATYDYSGVAGSYLYGYATNGGCDNISVQSGEKKVAGSVSIEDYPIVFPMGNAQEGEKSSVTINAKSDTATGSFKLMVYALNQSVYENAYSRLADEQLELTHFEDTKIKGTVNAFEDGIMFFSIPYEKGWSVYVDGEKVETVALAHAMLGAKVPAGQHEIELKYIPDGFIPGTTATGVSAVLCGVIAFFDKKKKKNGVPEETAPEKDDKPAEMDDALLSGEKDESNTPAAKQEETAEEEAAESAEITEEKDGENEKS
ncbi:MAG: hypothetical protein E7497_05340 [Ruminococcus sp.]|nr:hypothetical protein [Ruminococcus sp.]